MRTHRKQYDVLKSNVFGAAKVFYINSEGTGTTLIRNFLHVLYLKCENRLSLNTEIKDLISECSPKNLQKVIQLRDSLKNYSEKNREYISRVLSYFFPIQSSNLSLGNATRMYAHIMGVHLYTNPRFQISEIRQTELSEILREIWTEDRFKLIVPSHIKGLINEIEETQDLTLIGHVRDACIDADTDSRIIDHLGGKDHNIHCWALQVLNQENK